MQTPEQRHKEAQNFLEQIPQKYPHLVKIGYQKLIDATVEGMKSLEIYSDHLTAAKFLAGLQFAMTTGVLPNEPARVVEVPAAPTAKQIEDAEIARQSREDAERDARYRKQQWKSPKHNHALDPQTGPDGKEKASALAERQAEERCKLISGRTHSETAQISKVFIMKPGTSEIDWRATEAARLRVSRSGDQVRSTNYRY